MSVTHRTESPAVVFLHHFGGSAETWREVIQRLSKLESSVRSFALDLHGFGNANQPDEPTGYFRYTVDDYASQVAGFIKENAIGRFVLVGHSMGGKIAAALAARRPVGLVAMLLVAPSPPSPEPMSDADRSKLMEAHDDPAIATEIVAKSTFAPPTEMIQARTVSDIMKSSKPAWRAWLEHGSREDISQRMSQIDVPVVVIAACHDPVMSASLLREKLITQIAGSTLVVVPDAAHLVPLDAPTAIVRQLRNLMELIEVQPTSASNLMTKYPPGTIRALLKTDLVTEPTKRVLADRLAAKAVTQNHFFTDTELQTLQGVCERLIPQEPGADAIDIANAIDARLAIGTGDGWRYDVLPSDGDAYRLGLRAIEESTFSIGGMSFCDLAAEKKDQILRDIQQNRVTHGSWTNLPSARFFEELLAEASAIYFSHPLVQERIGYTGMADRQGWNHVALNMLDPQEPKPIGDQS